MCVCLKVLFVGRSTTVWEPILWVILGKIMPCRLTSVPPAKLISEHTLDLVGSNELPLVCQSVFSFENLIEFSVQKLKFSTEKFLSFHL